jgi:hypothetical protein
MRLVLRIMSMPDPAANMNRRDLPVTRLPSERDFRNPQNRAIIRFTLTMATPFGIKEGSNERPTSEA